MPSSQLTLFIKDSYKQIRQILNLDPFFNWLGPDNW